MNSHSSPRTKDSPSGFGFRKLKSPPGWVYTWGRVFRFLSFPFDLLFRLFVTRVVILGTGNLVDLPDRLIFAGTHHSFADMSLVRDALSRTAARRFARRLLVATSVYGLVTAGLFAWYTYLAFGLYPVRRRGEGNGRASLIEIARLIAAGNSLLIFPQGQHVRPEQEKAAELGARFRPGVARLAAGLGLPVVPFGLAGTERLIPPFVSEYHGLAIAGIPVSLHRTPLAIAFGPPLLRYADESDQAFSRRLQTVCFALTCEAEQALRDPAAA